MESAPRYPEMFSLPKGVYETKLPKPLGIAFEEREPGKGVVVDYLVRPRRNPGTSEGAESFDY